MYTLRHPPKKKLYHFRFKEFACKCGCGRLPSEYLMTRVDRLRASLGTPLHVTSGARCHRHNVAVGGATASFHVLGLAVDLRWPVAPRGIDLLVKADAAGFKGFGLYKDFVHLDLREKRAFWTA